MKNRKPNAALVWKQFEDVMVRRLRLPLADRAVYLHLVRHSRLEGQLQFRFSISWLARGTRLCNETARWAVRRLVERGALRLLERSTVGHLVEVYLPEEIPAIWTDPGEAGETALIPKTLAASLEEVDFFKTTELREAIHARERGFCFYCLGRTNALTLCLDHVVPRAHFGRNSCRNLVSCCLECNSRKGAGSAADFLRRLCREGRLTGKELSDRLGALEELAAGNLRPQLPKPFSDRCTGGL